jgi:penicillin-binding protein 1C
MLEVERPGSEGGWREFTSSRKIAWKTGTSFGFRDGWAVGFTPEYVVGVWTGNVTGEGSPGLIGIETAAPILFGIFERLPATTWFKKPEVHLRSVTVCKQSGYRPGLYCTEIDTIEAPEAGYRAPACPYHKLIHLDRSERFQTSSNCYPVANMVNREWFVLPATMEAYYRERHSDYRRPPPFAPECDGETLDDFSIVYPEQGAKLYVPKEVSGEKGKIVFVVSHRNASTTLHWHLDDQYIGSTDGIHEFALSPEPGQHLLTLVDGKGVKVSRRFNVIGDAGK